MKEGAVETIATVQNLSKNKTQSWFLTEHKNKSDPSPRCFLFSGRLHTAQFMSRGVFFLQLTEIPVETTIRAKAARK
jgi:hypothetical protein